MKLTKFLRLKQAISNLDVHLISKRILKLEEHLQKHGLALDPQNTAITQEGIFYIDRETGMATKVVLYIAGAFFSPEKQYKKEVFPTGNSDEAILKRMHPYHILRCNILAESEKQGWKENYKITQRTTGSFYYCIANEKGKIYQEIENQRLLICENCFMKVISIMEGMRGVKRESFILQRFFDVDFTYSWNSYDELSKDRGFLTDIYPEDWIEISSIRKQQVDYHCESCLTELSDPSLRTYLHVYPTDHIKRKIGYVKLECLCIACMAELSSRQHLKESREYLRYIKLRDQGFQQNNERIEEKRSSRRRSVGKGVL